MKVLVLEDDQDFREAMLDALEDEGYELEGVASGLEAVERARTFVPDLLIADIRMAGMDGLTALATIRETHPELATLVVTGYSSEADTIRALRLGVGDLLKKPFRPAELRDCVRGLLDRRRREQHAADRERVLESLALWAAESLVRPLDLAAGTGMGQVASARLVLQMARGLGCPPAEARLAQMSVLAHAVPELPEPLSEALPEPIVPEDESLPAQLVRWGMTAARQDLETALAQAPEAWRPWVSAPPPAEEKPRALLSLARAVEAAGDLESARQGYRSLLQADPSPREALQAWTGLVRAGVPEHVADALQAAERVGPAALGSAALELADLVGRAQPERAVELAERAVESLSALGQRAEEARARTLLALWNRAPLEEPLGLLLEHRQQLLLAAPWLARPLLENPAAPLARTALERLAREAPATLRQALEQGPLPARARELAAELMGEIRVRFHLYTLGGFELLVEEKSLAESAFRSQKTRFLLALLASRRGKPVAEDQILDEFWAEFADTRKRRVYAATTELRSLLGKDRVVRSKAGLELNPDLPWWHDAEELGELLASGRNLHASGRRLEAIERVRQADKLYRGPFLEDCYLDWAVRRRELLEQELVESLASLGDWLAAELRWQESLEAARRLLELDRLHQAGHVQVMQALTALGRPEEALRQFEVGKKRLAAELQTEPSTAMLEAYHRARLTLP